MFKTMSIKQLVVYLELGFLGFTVFVLLLASLDKNSNSVLPGSGSQALLNSQVEQLAAAGLKVTVLNPKGRKEKPEDSQGAVFLPATADNDQTAMLWEREEWLGDLDEMLQRRTIRALVPFSRTFFFLERGKKRGLTYETLMEYEKFLNKGIKGKNLGVHVVVIPTLRSAIFNDLRAGLGDIAAGNLTITPERQELVDFTDPTLTNVEEIIVTNSRVPQFKSIFDLAGREILVRKSSSYYESLLTLNTTLLSIGKKPVKIVFADEYLEDEDLLEMVNADLVPMVIIDSHKGEFWTSIFTNIQLHKKVRLRTDGEIAWAVRKNSPLLKKSINQFVRTVKKGSLTGNILYQRYLQDTTYIRNSLSDSAMKRYNQTIELFKKYAGQYDFPYLLLTALAYQESGLDQQKKSKRGAVGIMQILPTTAADSNVNIKNINKMSNNIHAGTRYLRFMADRYFSDPGLTTLNRDLFTLAAYNAGPARVVKLRKEAARRGLDPDIWFNNVEIIASAQIGRETVQYVRNIYKYYMAYDYVEKKFKQKKDRKKDNIKKSKVVVLKPGFVKKRP